MDLNVSRKRSGKRLFRISVYITISNSYLRLFRKDPSHESLQKKWRAGYNLYMAERFLDSLKYLTEVCAKIESSKLSSFDESFQEKVSFIYLTSARCCFKMFLVTHQHYHLEAAYHKYERSIKSLPIDFLTAIRLPSVLFEFGRLLECYGSFESALATYGRVLTRFQNYKGYFDVMYRSALVGKFVASHVDSLTKKHDMIKQCLDILQFILEAVPPTINEVHVLFLYCTTLEVSPDPAFRYQIPDAFKALHKLCRSLSPPLFSADQSRDHRVWMEDPFLWYNCGVYFLQDHELLLARDAFALFIKNIPLDDEGLTIDILLTIAKNCANFQNYEEAVLYADRALAKDKFNKEVRSLLSAWSEIRRAELDLEEDSATAILKVWRTRCWQPGYRRRYAKLVVNELEHTMALPAHKYDPEVRNELAYFARDKWRARFLFEDECARRIQKTFRGARIILSMNRAGREKYKILANQAYAAVIKKPFDQACRAEVTRISKHRFCPKHHPILGFAEAMKLQDQAHAVLRKNLNIFRLKLFLLDAQTARAYRQQVHKVYASIMIQKAVRMRLAVMRCKVVRKILRRRHDAAAVIQRFYKNRNNSFRHTVHRLVALEKWKKERAVNLIVMLIVGKIKRRRAERVRARTERRACIKIQRMYRRRKERKIKEREYRRKVFVLQAFFRGNTSRITSKMALKLLRKRKEIFLSSYVQRMFRRIDDLDFSYRPYALELEKEKVHKVSLADRKDLWYRNPGVRQNSEIFEAALQRTCVVCLGQNDFSREDCMLLSSLLRHPLCRIQRVVFQDVDGRHSTFEFDLIQAMGKSISLRSVAIVGGFWHPMFFVSLLECVQKINPRIIELCIEELKLCRIAPNELTSIAISCGKLVSDFFNYSVPGIRTLSLHNIGLTDSLLGDLVTGLGVNSSLTNLTLSMNLIEDKGCCGIIRAISSNRRSLVTDIDLSFNLITGLSQDLSREFKRYKNPIFGRALTVKLANNHIRFHLDIGGEFRNDLIVVYELESGHENYNPSASKILKPGNSRRDLKPVGHSRTADNLLSPVIGPRTQRLDNKTKVKFKSKPKNNADSPSRVGSSFGSTSNNNLMSSTTNF